MYYLIHTPQHPRPYLSSVSFLANDFASWGWRVTRYPADSPYIAEIRYQEKRHRPSCRRIELMEVWAKEMLVRRRRGVRAVIPAVSVPEMRKERASALVQDFFSALSVFESPIVAPNPLQNDVLPLPAYPLALVAKYTRLLCRCMYTTQAVLPAWADSNIMSVDQVALEFRFEQSLKRFQLAHAMNEAIGKESGRMGKIERCDETGVTKVIMWVDVGDLVMQECGKDEDPVPTYEKGGWEWPPKYAECTM